MITLNISLFVWFVWGLFICSGVGLIIDSNDKKDISKGIYGLLIIVLCMIALVI